MFHQCVLRNDVQNVTRIKFAGLRELKRGRDLRSRKKIPYHPEALTLDNCFLTFPFENHIKTLEILTSYTVTTYTVLQSFPLVTEFQDQEMYSLDIKLFHALKSNQQQIMNTLSSSFLLLFLLLSRI